MTFGAKPPKLDSTPRDVGMVVVDVALAMATKDIGIKQGLIPEVMARIAMLVGGALVNAVAFLSSN